MKGVMIIAVLAFMTVTVQAQMLVDRLVRKYKHSPRAEYVHTLKMMTSLAKTITINNADGHSRYVRHINSTKVLDMEDCLEATKQQSFKDVARLKTVGYEELMTAKGTDKQAVVMVKRSKTRVRELVTIDSGDDDAALIQILGDIRNPEIQKILAEEKKK